MIDIQADILSTTIHNTTPIVALVLAMVICILVIPVVWRYAKLLGMIDEPGERKVHLNAIPRVGGLGIIAGALIAIFSLADLNQTVTSFLAGSLVIIFFGIWDDIRQISPRIKFVGQILAISIVVFYGDLWINHLPFTENGSVPAWIGIPFTFFAIIGMTNAVNTSDGLDGMAGGESVLSLLVIAFLAYIAGGVNACVIATGCLGGILGFLRYNTHPAQIFMGDTGSQFLGFALGFLAVLVTQDVHPALSPAITLLFLGLPVIDLIGVMVMRIRKGNSPFNADRTHIHHRLLDLGFDHYETVIIIYSIQALLVISAIFLRYQSDALIFILYTFSAVIIFSSLNYAEKNGWQASSQGRTPIFKTIGYFRQHKIDIIELASRVIAIIIPLYFLLGSLTVDAIPRDFGIIATVFFILMLLDMFFQKEHSAFSLRGGVYITAIFSVYLVTNYEVFSLWENFKYLPFLLLAFCIAIVVRYAKYKKFQTSPMDYLIIFGVLVIAVFGGRYLQVQAIGVLVIQSIVILYGCEVLLMRLETRLNSLNLSALATLGIISYRGLIG